MITRHLPLHLGRVCSEAVQEVVANVLVSPPLGPATMLGEAFPIDFAPCLQAVGASAAQKRPSKIQRVFVAADPRNDLPAIRQGAEGFLQRIAADVECVHRVGSDVTLEVVQTELPQCDIGVLGAHGVLDVKDPLRSHLDLADDDWTLVAMIAAPRLERQPVLILSACSVGAVQPTAHAVAANGIPGALISAGASAVLASLWPLEDVSGGYAVERFVHHLAHPGFSPAAALFRAVLDLRRWPVVRVLDRCRETLSVLLKRGASEAVIRLDNIMTKIEDAKLEYPFDHPMYWGGLAVIGAGWRKPAGALIGRPTPELLHAVAVRQDLPAMIAAERWDDVKHRSFRCCCRLFPTQSARSSSLHWPKPLGGDACPRH